MFNLGPLELVAIFVVALLVFGPDKLPEIGRQVGRAIKEFRRIQNTFQSEFSDVLKDPPPGPVIPASPAQSATAAAVEDAAAQDDGQVTEVSDPPPDSAAR